MTDDELIEFAKEFRDGVLDGRASAGFCLMVCAPLAGLLSFHGVDVELIEGKGYETSTENLSWLNHFWLKLPDGRVLDPTADQFNTSGFEFPPVYLGEPKEIHR